MDDDVGLVNNVAVITDVSGVTLSGMLASAPPILGVRNQLGTLLQLTELEKSTGCDKGGDSVQVVVSGRSCELLFD